MESKIWMLANYPLWRTDGYATRVNGAIAELRRLGHEVGLISVFSPKEWLQRSARVGSRHEFRSKGIETAEIVCFPIAGSTALRAVSSRLCSLSIRWVIRRRRIRILHAQGIRAAALAGEVDGKVKVIVDIHGDLEAEALVATQSPGNSSPKPVSWARQDTDKALRRADALVVVSDAMESWLRRRSPALVEKPVAIVPTACHVDEIAFRSEDEGARDRESPLRICYLGGLQWYQSPSLIAEAAARLAAIRKVDFWVITPSRHSEIRAMFDELGLAVEVQALDRAEVDRSLHKADIGIVPRRAHPANAVASPTKIGEYLAAGVPVLISSAVGEWARKAADWDVGLSLEAETHELGAFLEEVQTRREDFRLRCRSIAEREFSWDALSDRLERLYSAAASRADYSSAQAP